MTFRISARKLWRRPLILAPVLLLAAPAFANAPFGSEMIIESGFNGASNVAAGDLDGVNGADVFSSSESDQVLRVALQQAGSTWSSQTLTPNARSRGVEMADLDGDGDLDLFYGDFNGDRVYWRENDLDVSGTFLARQPVGGSIGSAQGVTAADIDGDTDLDVVVAGRTADGYFWIENTNGDAGAWTNRTIASGVNAAQVVVAADLDGDGDLDVAGGSASGSGKLAWYENANGDGSTWVGRDIYSATILAVEAGDLDLDGDLDLLVQDRANSIRWWENTAGDGTAWTDTVITTLPGNATKGLQAVDLDFDGDLDVVGDQQGDWWENTSKASSWTRRSYTAGTDVVDTGAIDMDGDGDIDIVAARVTADQVSWWPNLTCSPGDADDDSDGVRNGCDVCAGFDDTQDADGDLTPDGCDLCPGEDDRVDIDGGGVPDACEGSAAIAIDNVTVAEGNAGTTAFVFTVTLTGSVAGGFTVDYATQDGAATTADSDYTATSGTLAFAGTDGEQQTLSVQVHGDLKVEAPELFLVVLGTPSNPGVTVDDDTGNGTIANDDIAALSIDDPFVAEGDSGTTSLVFTVTSTGEVDGGFTVEYFSGDETAMVADGDYLPTAGILPFAGADGEQQTIIVDIVGDTKVEADERLSVQLRNASLVTVTIPDGTGHGTLINDDSATVAIDDVTHIEGDSGTTAYQYTVTLTNEVVGGFTVPWATADGTATVADGDYVAASGTLSFTGIDGESRSFVVLAGGDTTVEADETFTVELGSPSNLSVTPSDGSGLGTITNDDAASVAIDDVSMAEGDSGTAAATFTVTLTGDVAGGFTVPYATSDGTATIADSDYASASGALTFAGTDGEAQTVSATIQGDTVVESDESFTVELGSPSNLSVTPSDGSGLGTITNDDAATVAIDDVTADEGDSGTMTFTFTVTLAGDVDDGFTVPFASTDGTATTADSDYTAAAGTLTFGGSDGETQTLSVTVQGDTVVEADETFTVELGSPSLPTVTAGDGSGLGTITNDDSAAVVIGDFTAMEGDAGTSTFTFDVTLTGDVAGGFTVPYSTADGTATTADSDYVAAAGTLTFVGTDGETQTLSVTVQGDAVVEGDETFTVELGSPSLPTVTAGDGSGLGTITNDDSATVVLGDVTAAEGDAGSTTFTFDATLTGDVAGGFTVPYSTADGTATTADSDYAVAGGTLTFGGSDGETQTLSVTIQGDAVVEADETFTVELGSPSLPTVTAGDGSGLGTITNDDSATVAIGDVTAAESDVGATTFTFTVTLAADVAGGFTVPYSTADGTATTADSDYASASGALNFVGTDGETQTLSVDIQGDTVVEPDESFAVTLGTPSNASVTASDDTGVGTITNDDSATVVLGDVTAAEGDAGSTTFTFDATLTGDVAGGFTVPYSTADGTATTADSDYTVAGGTLTFGGSDGETQTLSVTIQGDAVVEADETFTVELGSPSLPTVTAGDGSGLGTITNDDSATVAIGDVTAAESDVGATTFTFTVTLAADVAGGFTVPYSTADGTATTADSDYTAAAGTLSFAGSDDEVQTLDVTVQGDTKVELDEIFSVVLDPPSNPSVTLADGTGVGTIENDDVGPLLFATKEIAAYVLPFDTVIYRIVITNLGDGDQLDDPGSHEFEDLLPPELEIRNAGSDSPAFAVVTDPAANAVYGNGTLEPGALVEILIEAAILAEADTSIANQGTIRFDADHDGVNDSADVTDDPSVPGDGDATVLVTVRYVEIPALGGVGLALLALLLGASGVAKSSADPRNG